METECEKEINEKDCHNKKDLKECNIKNIKERKSDSNTEEKKEDVIQASDMDKMLEDCNRYLNECEEVLQDCAKYLDECDDTEDVTSDEGESNHIADETSISKDPECEKELNLNTDITSTQHQRENSDYDNTIPEEKLDVIEKEGMEKVSEGLKPAGHEATVDHEDTSKEIPNKMIEEGNEKSVVHDVASKDEIGVHNSDTSTEVGDETTVIDDDESKDAADTHDSNTSIDNERPHDGSIKVTLDHLETDSDDSMDSEEDKVNLVPLQIQEECDDATEKNKDNMKKYAERDVMDVDAEDDKIDVKLKTDASTSSEKEKCGSVSSSQVVSDKVVLDEISENENNLENDQKNTSALSQCDQLELDGNDSSAIQKKEDNLQLSINDKEMKSATSCVQKHDVKGGNNQHPIEGASQESRNRAQSGKIEMKALQEELSTTKMALKSTQGHLVEQQTKSNNLIMTLKLDLYKTQTALKQERIKSHQQLSEVISHLTLLESNLRKGQLKHRAQIKTRNERIETQKKEILKLKDQNEQLLNAIKEICANGGMNGYMREKHSEKKGHNGKLGIVKDKFLMKNRSSLELNNFNLEKYNLKNQRLCSSQEDLKNLHDDAFNQNSPNHEKGSVFGRVRGTSIRGSKYGNKNRKNLQNFFAEPETPNREINKTVGDSPQMSESSSGVFSMSDQEFSRPPSTNMNGHFDDDDDDDDDGHIFSFSSTHINTVIDEEEALGPIISHSGQLMSMGSMPMLAQPCEDPGQRIYSSKDRPHSLSSVDLVSIQRQAEKLSEVKPSETISEYCTTPPHSPSYNNNNNKPETGKSEMTPFQTFKTMFKRKGSKNKGNKKRSASLSQTTNTEYSEALKKHFQKYDMH